jgi:hypothetical protein
VPWNNGEGPQRRMVFWRLAGREEPAPPTPNPALIRVECPYMLRVEGEAP